MQRRFFLFHVLLLIAISSIARADADSKQVEFYNLWFPGVSAGTCYFFNTGVFAYGGSLRYDIMYGIETSSKNASFTSRGRWEVYIDVGLFNLIPETGGGSEFFFYYVVGFSTSLETARTLKRTFLIPYIGLEAGGICSQERGNGLLLCPLAGINIFSFPGCTLSIDTGLFLSTVAFGEFFGIRSQINFNFVF